MKALKPVYNILYQIIFFIAEILVRLLYPIRALGRENLLSGGFVLAPNHLSAIDPFFVILARGFGKKMLAMGKEELFGKNFLLDFFWNIAGVFPVDRGAGNRQTVENAMVEVRKGRGLLIFPEGTRSDDGRLGRLKSGAFVVAMEAGAPMIPCRIWYKAGRPKMFNRSTIIFGKPISQEEMGLTGEYSAKKLRAAKTLFAERLEALFDEYKDRL